MQQSDHIMERGFTLIELSIVLVIIGLIVGGVLAAQDLIKAAGVRAQITQIEKFKTAANTFFGKYGYLPGDIPQAYVTQFGFAANPIRPGGPGCGDGNGELDGSNYAGCNSNSSGGAFSYAYGGGETAWFWQDLSVNSGLTGDISSPAPIGAVTCASNTTCSIYFPQAKIGNAALVYVYSGYANQCNGGGAIHVGCGANFFGIGVINAMVSGGGAVIPPLTVGQAYAIDTKTDDGLPTTGSVLAQYPGGSGVPVGWSTNSSTASASTCYDTSSGTAKYSISYANGSLVTCSLSFKMQAGD